MKKIEAILKSGNSIDKLYDYANSEAGNIVSSPDVFDADIINGFAEAFANQIGINLPPYVVNEITKNVSNNEKLFNSMIDMLMNHPQEVPEFIEENYIREPAKRIINATVFLIVFFILMTIITIVINRTVNFGLLNGFDRLDKFAGGILGIIEAAAAIMIIAVAVKMMINISESDNSFISMNAVEKNKNFQIFLSIIIEIFRNLEFRKVFMLWYYASRCKKDRQLFSLLQCREMKKRTRGFCMVCAKESNIPQISEYMEQMGITDDDLEQMSDQMMEILDGDGFEMGGAETLPPYIQNMLDNAGLTGLKSVLSEKRITIGKILRRRKSPVLQIQEQIKIRKKQKEKKELKFLDNYCTNLNQRAEEGKLDNIIGRDKEISRVVQILSRRQKNNPCLIGEPGVGKTAIAEGIAQRIVSGNVPFNLTDKKVYLLDLTSLVAGTQFRGQFESRVKGLVNEVKSEGNIILFIDEVHNLVGTGDSEGSMNAANILKPALSRGEVQVIGATTFGEYRKYIEKDSALERRFQPVTVNEPTVDDTVEVLKGIKKIL